MPIRPEVLNCFYFAMGFLVLFGVGVLGFGAYHDFRVRREWLRYRIKMCKERCNPDYHNNENDRIRESGKGAARTTVNLLPEECGHRHSLVLCAHCGEVDGLRVALDPSSAQAVASQDDMIGHRSFVQLPPHKEDR
ncbi:MAG: hypothetical protein HYZ50_14790 [Deltaproteobacteria bacterium]|nr:hypothetical protein [Deltaproteobacteria bacterium]